MRRVLPWVLAVLAFLGVLTVAITQPAITRLRKDVKTTSRLIARLMSPLFLSVLTQEEVRELMREVIDLVDFPLVITDQNGNPRAWKNLSVDPDAFSAEELAHPERLRNDPRYERLLEELRALKSKCEPVPIPGGAGTVIGYIYYGEPRALFYLRLLQVLLPLLGGLAFGGLILAARWLRRYQAAEFWASFAKGLAHQLGTPASSLWGWLELLKRQEVDPRIVEGIERDLRRVRSVMRRFSKVGGKPKLEPVSLEQVAEEAVAEARERFLKLEVEIEGSCQVLAEPELISWAFEIFLKNAQEAGAKRVKIRVRPERRWCLVEVEDDGGGVPKEARRHLFKRGVSTKSRGWGVGLLLAKRIIEEVHGGRVWLAESRPGRTVFAFRIPLN